jgi:hypothetical protein
LNSDDTLAGCVSEVQRPVVSSGDYVGTTGKKDVRRSLDTKKEVTRTE